MKTHFFVNFSHEFLKGETFSRDEIKKLFSLNDSMFELFLCDWFLTKSLSLCPIENSTKMYSMESNITEV